MAEEGLLLDVHSSGRRMGLQVSLGPPTPLYPKESDVTPVPLLLSE